MEFKVTRLRPADISTIDSIINKATTLHKNISQTVSIYYSLDSDSYRLCITYRHPLLPNKNSFSTVDTLPEETLADGIERVIAKYKNQYSCEHRYVRPLDKYGKELDDGRAVCQDCEFEHPKGLTKGKAKVIRMSMSSDGDLCTKLSWPDDCYLQGGNSGIVFSEEGNYQTAFCEAFLSVSGVKTFIRGEGGDIFSAEKECHQKLTKMTACREHQFTREIGKKQRRDGYAKCSLCGLAGSVLEPLDLCSVCKKPTSTSINGTFYCSKHELDVSFDEALKNSIEAHQSTPFLSRVCNKEIEFKLYTERAIKSFWINKIGQEEFDKNWDSLNPTLIHFRDALLRKYFGKKGLSMKNTFPSTSHPSIMKALNAYFKNAEKILAFSQGRGDLLIRDLV